MNANAKVYRRLGAMAGSVIGVLLMMLAVCLHKTALGAALLIACACAGTIAGNAIERKIGERT